MSRRDWTLLAIATAGQSGLSPAQLQKSLFLLGKAYPKEVGEDFYQFKPYNYGPFCVDIYLDAQALEREGLVAIENPGTTWSRRYLATSAGTEKATEIRRTEYPKAVEYLGRAVQWTRSVSFPDLVRAIYDRFPDQKVHSVFQG